MTCREEERREAIAAVRRIRAEAEALRRAGAGPKLVAPGCERGCRTCYRACAVKRINLAWWERELASLGGDPDVPTLAHAGIAYIVTAGQA